MKIEDARKIIQEESLQGYNLCEERENRENEVVLKKENEKWIVYVTDMNVLVKLLTQLISIIRKRKQ